MTAEVSALFAKAKSRQVGVRGWLTDQASMTLITLALQAPHPSVVEIGSFAGLSAISLGTAMEMRAGIVFCIDPFDCSGETPGVYQAADLYREWEANITKAGLRNVVAPVRNYSQCVAKWWKHPIGLLYIDGDHSYEAVKQDLHDWTPWIVPGGYLVMDDANETGVALASREFIKRDEWLDATLFFGRTLVAKKGS